MTDEHTNDAVTYRDADFEWGVKFHQARGLSREQAELAYWNEIKQELDELWEARD